MTAIPAPRSGGGRGGRRTNWEKWGWIYMRASGVLLVVLIFGHLFVNLMVGEGISQINFGFVAGRWANPFWQAWDLIMLWLAEIHGANGLRTVINDYARKDGTRFWLQLMLAASVVLILGVGTLVIFTFDPCPVIDGVAHVAPYCPAP